MTPAETFDRPCPCGSGKRYADCCGPLVAGVRIPATAEALMRSRFTAYALRDAAHIARTWATATRPQDLSLPAGVVWRDLEILRIEAGGEGDEEGLVEFVAHCTVDGQAHALHEASRFMREHGEWRYLDGETPKTVRRQVPRVGRNAPCPCGSGKKFKRCCGQRA